VIYVATVHWVDPKWVEPQRRYLEACLDAPFRVFANLQGVEDHRHDASFDFVTRSDGTHPDKLNELAKEISVHAEADDVLMFLDGDAFPVRPLDGWMEELLSPHPLAAVRRDENAGDVQPHPCFCVTTVGFWNDVGGDWRPGTWLTAEGVEAQDVGGRLLSILDERSIGWRPILRSNAVNLHPVLYGIYEHHVYHHGAGFRPPIARADEANVPVAENEDYLWLKTRAHGKSIRQLRPRHAPQLARLARDSLKARKLNAYIREEGRRSDETYRDICVDSEFYRRFETKAREPGRGVSDAAATPHPPA
jgi:hypothetical protein